MMSKFSGWNRVCLLLATVALSGCVSTVFPDFEDDSEIVITDGGKVEVREVDEKGILVGDKENAAYEDDEEYAEAVIKPAEEKVEPAKVVEVVASDIEEKDEAVVKDEPEEVVENVADKAEIEPLIAQKPKEAEEPKEAKAFEPTVQYLAATINFDNGGAAVDAKYNKNLREIAKQAKDNDAYVLVYGFASSRTRDTDPASHKLANFKVSAERAENTARVLRRFGVPANRIITQALSDSMPLYQEVMPEGERLNRRAEIYIAY